MNAHPPEDIRNLRSMHTATESRPQQLMSLNEWAARRSNAHQFQTLGSVQTMRVQIRVIVDTNSLLRTVPRPGVCWSTRPSGTAG